MENQPKMGMLGLEPKHKKMLNQASTGFTIALKDIMRLRLEENQKLMQQLTLHENAESIFIEKTMDKLYLQLAVSLGIHKEKLVELIFEITDECVEEEMNNYLK